MLNSFFIISFSLKLFVNKYPILGALRYFYLLKYFSCDLWLVYEPLMTEYIYFQIFAGVSNFYELKYYFGISDQYYLENTS